MEGHQMNKYGEVDMSYFDDEVRDGFLVPGMMKRFWARNFKAYKVLENECQKRNVNCSAIWGTLLGAVRHGGYIPWDDDIDVEMKHDEYKAIEESSQKGELPGEYHISDYVITEQENMVRRWMSSGSLIEKYTEWESNYGSPFVAIIDIFLHEYMPQGNEEKKYWYILERAGAMKEISKSKDKRIIDLSYDKELKEVGKMLGASFERSSGIPVFIQLLMAMDEFCLKYNSNNCDNVAIPAYYRNNPGRLIPKRLYERYIDMKFEFGTVKVPVGYDGILRRYFGEYMTPVLNFGIHGYPAYEGMNRDAKKYGGFELAKYIYNETDIFNIKNKRKKKTRLKDELHQSLELFISAHEYIYNAFKDDRIDDELIDILVRCQELALSTGERVENKAVGGKESVYWFEKYCEDVFVIYKMLTDGETIDNNELNTRYIAMKEFELTLASITDGIEEIKDVLFLVNSPSEWYTLHTMWKAAQDDPRSDVTVISVPYYRRDFRMQIDKSDIGLNTDGYPEEVKLTPYDSYDLEDIHPDIIIMQSPYDEYGSAKTVHPYFYSANLYVNTDKLVLVPPFRLREIHDNETQLVYTFGTYLKNRGTALADTIVVQSDNMGNVLEDILYDWGYKFEGQIVSEGLPMDDLTEMEIYNLSIPVNNDPYDIFHEINSDKYIIVSFTLCASVVFEYGETYINEVKNRLWKIHDYNEKIIIIWFEDIYADEILKHYPRLLNSYTKLIELFIHENIGKFVKRDIVERTDISYIVNRCHAMIGDGCVLMNEFRMKRKPVLWLTPGAFIERINDNYRRIEECSMAIEGAKESYWTLEEFINSISKKERNSIDDEHGMRIWKRIRGGYKNVAIVYERGMDSHTADKLEKAIIELGKFEVYRCPIDELHSIEKQYTRWKTNETEMVISINLAGFEWKNSGGNSAYSMLNGNSIHCIDRDIPDEEERLAGLLPITMTFVVNEKRRYERIKKTYKRIHEPVYVSDMIKGVCEVLENTDWRM